MTDEYKPLFGVANPPPGKEFDFNYADVRNYSPGHIVIRWGAKGVGFGELGFRITKEGDVALDTEMMSKLFLEELFTYIVSKAKIDPDPFPEAMTFEEAKAEYDERMK